MAEPSTVGDDLAKLNLGDVPDVRMIDLMFLVPYYTASLTPPSFKP